MAFEDFASADSSLSDVLKLKGTRNTGGWSQGVKDSIEAEDPFNSGGFSDGLIAIIQKTAAECAQDESKQFSQTGAQRETKFKSVTKLQAPKKKRSELNDKYEELCDMLELPRDFRRRKLQILSLAIDELRRAKQAGFTVSGGVSSVQNCKVGVTSKRLRNNDPASDSGEELPVPQINGMLDELDVGAANTLGLVKGDASLSGLFAPTFGTGLSSGFSGPFQTFVSGTFEGMFAPSGVFKDG